MSLVLSKSISRYKRSFIGWSSSVILYNIWHICIDHIDVSGYKPSCSEICWRTLYRLKRNVHYRIIWTRSYGASVELMSDILRSSRYWTGPHTVSALILKCVKLDWILLSRLSKNGAYALVSNINSMTAIRCCDTCMKNIIVDKSVLQVLNRYTACCNYCELCKVCNVINVDPCIMDSVV